MIRVLSAIPLIVALSNFCRGQQGSTPSPPDSLTLDALMYGAPYRFTGAEDPVLLARVFEETYKLGLKEAGKVREPAVLCLAVGRAEASDAPAAVLRLLANHLPAVRPGSACRTRPHGLPGAVDSASGKPAWILTITSLAPRSGDTFTVHSRHYVASLWAAGWVCQAQRLREDWRIFACSKTWVS